MPIDASLQVAGVLERARRGGTPLRSALYDEYAVSADVDYLRTLLRRRTEIGARRLDGAERQRWPARDPARPVYDDLRIIDPATRLPDGWARLFEAELTDGAAMLAHKLDALDAVSAFWHNVTSELRPVIGAELQQRHQQQMGELEARRRSALNVRSGGISADRRDAASLVDAHKQEQRRRYRSELADLRAVYPERALEIFEAAVQRYVAERVRRDGPKERRTVMAKLELAGFLVLPSGLPLAGRFPAEDFLVDAGGLPSFDQMMSHANRLMRKYGFLDAGSGNRLMANGNGCFCIMFAEERTRQGGKVMVPFFGTSGSRLDSERYLRLLGTPSLDPPDQEVRFRATLGRAGQRLTYRFFRLREWIEARRTLDLKLPSKQAIMSYMQYLERPRGALPADTAAEDRTLFDIEMWHSLQCAEPAAVLAAAQLHYRMADMELSVPFEAKDLRPDGRAVDASRGWGKETCGRCASSEIAFAGVVQGGARREVNMRALHVRRGDVERALGDHLVNHRTHEPAYPGGADGKRARTGELMEAVQPFGVAQPGQRRFFADETRRPLAEPVAPGGDLLSRIRADFRLAPLFIDDSA